MAEKIEIARLEFDTTALVKSVSDAEEAMVQLKVEHLKLKGATEKDTDAIIKNVAAQKKVKTELNKNVKALSELVDTKGKLNNVTKQTNIVLNKEVKSIQDARDNNKKLNAIRNKVNLTTKEGRKQLELLNKKLDKNNQFIRKNVDAYQKQKIGIGKYSQALKGLTARFTGVALVAGAVFGAIRLIGRAVSDAIRVIVEFDKQLIAVGKTTNLSKEDLKNFGKEVVNLGRELKGISTINLLKTAEVAGQLGIRGSENILKFAETIEKLGLTSDIVGQDSARSFAKFIELSSDSVENADRLGSVITQLGNNFATTEGEILKNTIEIQKGVAIYKTSAEGVIALGAATSALGSQAEVSRGAFQKTFKVLNDAATSGKNLDKILKLTGQTQKEFVKEFSTDAISTFDKFIKGLSDSSDRGENLSNTLSSLGLNQLRVSAVIGSLAKNYDVLERSLSQANNEYKTNTALNTEALAATKSLNSIVGDLGDSWDNLILSIESGDGVLASFTKSIIISSTNFVETISDINSLSNSFTEFALNLIKSTTIQGRVSLQTDVIIRKSIKSQIDARKKLTKIVVEAAKKEGEYDTQINFRISEITRLTNKQVAERLKAIEDVENAKRLEVEAEKKRVEDVKTLTKKEQEEQLKDQIKFNKEKLKIDNEAAINALDSKLERDKLKIDQSNTAKKLEIDKLKVSHAEKEALKKQLDDAAFEEKKVLDDARVLAFEESKKKLQEEIALNNAVDEEAKAILKATQRAEQQILELEQIQLEETEKAELKKLILQKYNQEVADITEKAAIKSAKEKLTVTKKEIDYEKEVALARISISQQLGRILTGLLGDSLGARLAAIAFDAIMEISKLKIATAAAQQINMANATAIAIPTAGASVIAAKASNLVLGISSKRQQGNILKSAAVSGLGSVKFEKGGLQEIGGKRHSSGGTKFVGEDGTRFEAEKGELIGVMNRTAASAFMAFNNSHGGGGGASVSNYLQQGGIVEQSTSQAPQIDIESILQSMPTPVVDVKDIITEVSNRVNLVDGANY